MESTLENSEFKPPTSIRKSPFSTTLDPYIKELIFNKKYDTEDKKFEIPKELENSFIDLKNNLVNRDELKKNVHNNIKTITKGKKKLRKEIKYIEPEHPFKTYDNKKGRVIDED